MAEQARVLLVRLDGLGDALACVPALEGLRRALPQARFGAVCSSANAPIFARNRMEAIHIFGTARSEQALTAELRSARYSDALVATEEPVGYRLARGSGAARRVGFWHRFEKPLKSAWQFSRLTDAVYRPAAWIDRPEHEAATLYRLSERLGAQLPVPNDPTALRQWLEVDKAGDLGAGALAFQISPKLTSGDWGPAAIAGFAAEALAASPCKRLILLAAVADQGLVRSVMEHVRRGEAAASIAAAAPADIPRWLGTLASATALISPDTGAAHAAGMLGVPVVDLFDADRFEQLSQQWKPWAAPSRCLIKPPYRYGIETQFGRQVGAALGELLLVARAV